MTLARRLGMDSDDVEALREAGWNLRRRSRRKPPLEARVPRSALLNADGGLTVDVGDHR